jgi:glyoxylase-like metal-dependent hydrolase (beta-lactamase superfamily II)
MVSGNQVTQPPSARFYRHIVGEVELFALSDGGLNYPSAMIFGNVPPDAFQRYRLPEKQVFIPYTILLVRAGGRLLLNDVGAGDFGNHPDAVFPGLDHTTSRTNLVLPGLKAAGINPEDIDMILITHAHPDHISGLFDAAGHLVYPNAHYYVPQKEYEYWMSADPSTAQAEALRHHLKMLVDAAKTAFDAIADQVTLVQDDDELLPGVRIDATHGHTPGHVLVTISTPEETVYNISDVVVHPLFLEHPEWAPAIDMDAAMADATRRRFLAQAAEQNALVFAHHLGPFPNLGRVVPKGDAWEWRPEATAGN